ncbi:hypothetical protein FOL47_001052 [Perkinsus chesapeaki]|uniref:Uncharacterized protein n=1 Tax=Perkinsus chesapeaki TaxID=330153 RepID=A0A7J6MKE8_PERCH|nr:hypothetical protein FOL47_001052 [Perkinsus chesapeaki]
MLRRTSPVLRRHVAHLRPVTSVSRSLPRRFYRNPVPPATHNPTPSLHSFYGEAVATKVDQLVKMAGVRSRRLQLAAGLVGFSLFALWMNKDKITSTVGTQGASVVRETISNKDLQDAAEATVRKMIEQILADESLRGVAGDWVMQLLNSRQSDIGGLMAKVIRLDAVQSAAKDLVANLCKDPYIIQQVSSLVVSTIYMQVVQDQAAKWTGELVLRPDVQEKLSQTASDTVRSEAVYDAVQEVATRVAQGVVNDPATSELLKERLTEVAADQELQAALSDSAWKVVSRSLNPFAKHPETVNGNGARTAVTDEQKSQEALEEPQTTEELPAAAEPLDACEEEPEEEVLSAPEPTQQANATVEPVVSERTIDAPEAEEAQGILTDATQGEPEPIRASEEEVTFPRVSEGQPSVDEKEAEILREPESVGVAPPSDDIPEEKVSGDIVSEEPLDLGIAEVSDEPDSYGKLRDNMIATGEWLNENYQKYRERARAMKEEIVARWRLRRSKLDDDSERFLFSKALRHLSGESQEVAEDRDTTGRESESALEQPANEEDSTVVDTSRDKIRSDTAGGSSIEATLHNEARGASFQSYETTGVDLDMPQGVLLIGEVPRQDAGEDVPVAHLLAPTDDSMSSTGFYVEPTSDDSLFTASPVEDRELVTSDMDVVGLPHESATAEHIDESQTLTDTQREPGDTIDTSVDALAGAVKGTLVEQEDGGAVKDTSVDQEEGGAVKDTSVDQEEEEGGAVKDTFVEQEDGGAVKDTSVDQEEGGAVKDTFVEQEDGGAVKDTSVFQAEYSMPAGESEEDVTPSEWVGSEMTPTHCDEETKEVAAPVSDGPLPSIVSSEKPGETEVPSEAVTERDSIKSTHPSGASSNAAITPHTTDPSASADDRIYAKSPVRSELTVPTSTALFLLQTACSPLFLSSVLSSLSNPFVIPTVVDSYVNSDAL